MNRRVVVFVMGICAGCIAGCSDRVPAPSYGQSRAIDQDIDATHANMPALASPSAVNNVSPFSWRNEEQIDQQRTQTGQLPQ